MISRMKKIILFAGLVWTFVCVMGTLPTFAAGLGKPVGIVQQVRGEVYITHADEPKGFEATRGMRLYKGDTIRTLDDGRLRMRLNDGSIISLASNTKLKLTRSVYAKKKKSRSSFFSMALGKARFFVVKVLNFKRSEFRVKTPTAVCGVRGSDFILEATATETIATALEDTELEFWSLAFLEEPPVILKDYEESIVGLNKRPTIPRRLPLDQIEEKKEQFIDVAPDKGVMSDDEMAQLDQLPDDTGVDKVGDLGGRMPLEAIQPVKYGDDQDFKEYEGSIKLWTPEETTTDESAKQVINEGIELPEFPDTP